MRLTRRNALIGLGTVAAGAGVIGGTGAFTSVAADRSVSISQAGDGSANVEIVVDPDGKHTGLTDDSGTADAVSLDFSSLNANAKTVFNDALEVTPTGSNGNYDVSTNLENPDGSDLTDSNGDAVDWVTLTVQDGTGVGTGTAVNIDMAIDLTADDPSTADFPTASDFPSDAVIQISVTQTTA